MNIQEEREAFESWWEGFHNGRQIACDYIEEDNSYSVGYANAQWVAWQAKAKAKAKAVPEPSINMTGHDLKYIWDFMDYADPENLDTEVTIQLCKEGFDGAGLYAWVAEYPEEGGIKLGEEQEQKG